MSFKDYKVELYRNQPDGWVAEIPAVPGCYALMPTREMALAELAEVFEMIRAEYGDSGQPLPADTTELVHAWRPGRREIGPPLFYRILRQIGIDQKQFEDLR